MDLDKERRKKLASLPFSEKLKILEKLRERSRVIGASDLRKMATRQRKGGDNSESTVGEQVHASQKP